MKRKEYTLEDSIKYHLKDPEFRRIWEESETEYQLGRLLIEKRLAKNISQRDLAKRARTTQAVISRIEGMNSNPSIELLKRIAVALEMKLEVSFK